MAHPALTACFRLCPQIMQLLTRGNRQRTQEPTATNRTSSRSHAVLQVTVRQQRRGSDLAEEVRVGRLFMVDLAGSERASQVPSRHAPGHLPFGLGRGPVPCVQQHLQRLRERLARRGPRWPLCQPAGAQPEQSARSGLPAAGAGRCGAQAALRERGAAGVGADVRAPLRDGEARACESRLREPRGAGATEPRAEPEGH